MYHELCCMIIIRRSWRRCNHKWNNTHTLHIMMHVTNFIQEALTIGITSLVGNEIWMNENLFGHNIVEVRGFESTIHVRCSIRPCPYSVMFHWFLALATKTLPYSHSHYTSTFQFVPPPQKNLKKKLKT